MKVLVVGGAGYIGGATVDFLLPYGHKVKVVDKLMYEDCYLKPIDFYHADVLDDHKMLPLLAWADAVIWLAAIVGDGACAINPIMTYAVNTDAVIRMVNNFKGRIIFPSTCSVYGAQDGILNEDSPTSPLSVYAKSKLMAENELPKSALILRLGTLFGLGDHFSRIRTDLALNTMTIHAVMNHKITVKGGAQWRPLLHVRDVARCMAQQVDRTTSGIYILNRRNMQMSQLATLIEELVPDTEIEVVEMPSHDLRNYQVDASKAKKDLSFEPQLATHDGIFEIAQIVRDGRLPDPFSSRFYNEKHLKQTILD